MTALRRRGWFGLQPSDRPPAVTLAAVTPQSPAAAAGLRAGDRVVACDAAPLPSAHALRRALGAKRAGDVVTLTLGDGRGLAVTAGSRPREDHPGLVTRYGEASAGSFALRTISVSPAGEGPFPTVVLLQGYAAASVERPPGVAAGDALGPLVAALARAGLCVWRTEKRGTGDSEGPPAAEAGFDEETDDHAAGLRAALAAPWVDARRVTLLGHSLGALHAPLLAARGGGVDRLALYGAGALPWIEYVADNTRRQGRLAGLDGDVLERLVDARVRFTRAVLLAGRAPAEVLADDPSLDPAALGLDDEGHLDGRTVAYWRGVAACPIAEPLVAAALPTLAAWGSADYLTSRAEHVTLAQIVDAAHPGRGHFREVVGADHGFFAHPNLAASYRARWSGELHPGLAAVFAAFAT